MAWTDKPNAIMRAELVTSSTVLEEIFQFCEANPMPRWLWHADEPPYPSRDQLAFYWERGNDIIIVRDQDDEMWAFRINSKKDGRPLWGHFRREIDEAHDTWEGQPRGGMTDNSRESAAHMNALTWRLRGEILPPFNPGDGINENVNRAHEENMNIIRARATELYNTVYTE